MAPASGPIPVPNLRPSARPAFRADIELGQHDRVSAQGKLRHVPRVLRRLRPRVLDVVVGAVPERQPRPAATGTACTTEHGRVPRDLDFDLACDHDGGNLALQVRPEDGKRRGDGREVDFEDTENCRGGAVKGWIEGRVGSGFVFDLRGKSYDGADDGAEAMVLVRGDELDGEGSC